MAKVTVLNPVGEVLSGKLALPALPAKLEGLSVGFLDNAKHNFDHLADGIGHVLTERFGVKRVVHLKKANSSTPAPAEMIAAMAKECDLVFAGSAD